MDSTSQTSATSAPESPMAQHSTSSEAALVKKPAYAPPVMTADNVPVEMKCPDCRKRIKSVVYSRLTDDARFAAGCLGCCAYAAMQGSDEFKVNRHHCPNCGIEIGCIVTTAHPDGTQTFRVLTPEEAKAAEPKVFKS